MPSGWPDRSGVPTQATAEPAHVGDDDERQQGDDEDVVVDGTDDVAGHGGVRGSGQPTAGAARARQQPEAARWQAELGVRPVSARVGLEERGHTQHER